MFRFKSIVEGFFLVRKLSLIYKPAEVARALIVSYTTSNGIQCSAFEGIQVRPHFDSLTDSEIWFKLLSRFWPLTSAVIPVGRYPLQTCLCV
jgi:hypothetical protein